MGIKVECACSETYDLNEAMAGRTMRCSGCDEVIKIPALKSAKNMWICPMCAEMIPSGTIQCPECDETIGRVVNSKQKKELFDKMVVELDAYLADQTQVDEDRKQAGRLVSFRTSMFCIVFILGLSLFLMEGQVTSSGAHAVVLFFGFMGSVIFGPTALVSFSNDWRAHNIQTAQSPEIAFSRFFKAVQTNRAKKAYAALVPTAKKIGMVEPLSFEEIPYDESSLTIHNEESFASYWQSVFMGTRGQKRTCNLQRVTLVDENDDMAVVGGVCVFMSRSLVTKTEIKDVYKLLVKRDGKWFFAESEFEGVLDDLDIIM